MTQAQFVTRRAWGQIAQDAEVRTVLFRFQGSEHEWAEVFVDGRYETIEQQEIREGLERVTLERFVNKEELVSV